MDLPNQPIALPDRPLVAPTGGVAPPAIAPAEDPILAETSPLAVPRRRVVTSIGTDLISSLQSLMGTVVIAIFVITFIVQAFQIPS